jgi:hypothetical protein
MNQNRNEETISLISLGCSNNYRFCCVLHFVDFSPDSLKAESKTVLVQKHTQLQLSSIHDVQH